MSIVKVFADRGRVINLAVDDAQDDITRELANVINAEVESGAITPEQPKGIGAPGLNSGRTGELIVQQSSFIVLPAGYVAVVVDANAVTLLGGGQQGQSVLSDGGGLSFLTGGGSGTVVASGGNNRIATGGDGWYVSLGNGKNTLDASTGAITLQAVIGQNDIRLGTGTALVETSGRDQIQGGSGAATVSVQPGAQAIYTAGAGTLLLIDTGAGSTVVGGSGAETIFAGIGDYSGGTDGNNLIYGSGTLTGGGKGDQLFATGQDDTMLKAGVGAETLSAALSTGDDTLVAGAGNNVLLSGSGREVFEFDSSNGGNVDLVRGFTSCDSINLVGYRADEIARAIAQAQVSAFGTTLRLPDNTIIAFAGLTDPTILSVHEMSTFRI